MKLEEEEFWHDIEKTREYQRLRKEVQEIETLWAKLNKVKDDKEIEEIEKKIAEKEILVFLSDEKDPENAVLFIQAGAGGQDAQDWSAILLRMYQRYCEKRGWDFEILEINYGEAGHEGRIGVKSAVAEVRGRFAFGFLKKESGVHRLVRISPFSSKGLRHTSFALVQILPKIKEEEIKIHPNELKIETFKASGPGGQYVNKRMSAIRITHLPTGISATCQSERSLAQNKERAMEILRSRLYHHYKMEKERELKKIKKEKISIDFGRQIRSYVFHPYKMVKDLRTNIEVHNVDDVLDGNLEPFIEAEIKNDKI